MFPMIIKESYVLFVHVGTVKETKICHNCIKFAKRLKVCIGVSDEHLKHFLQQEMFLQ